MSTCQPEKLQTSAKSFTFESWNWIDSEVMAAIRFLVLVVVILSASTEYFTRVNLSVALISMTSQEVTNATVYEVCPLPVDGANFGSTISENKNGARFAWNSKVKGIILGSYFYSYVLMQIPAGRMAELFGPKVVIATGLAGSAIINLLTPLLAHSVILLTTSRIMLGVVQGGVFPACFAMLCNWLPVKERNVAFGFIDFGINLGAILSGPITGALCDHMGWPYAFYLPGTMAVGVLVIFLLLTTSSPNDHPRVKSAELELIKNDHIQDGGAEEDSKPPLPWMKMLTSKVVIATIVARFAMGWTFLLIQTELPAYLSDILHMQPTKNGAVNSLMYISANITLASFGYLTESMIGRNWIGRTRARKLVIVASRLGMMVSFLCIPSAGCSQVTVVALLMTAMLFYGMGSGGDIPLPSELTKNYPATLFALINTIGSSAGFIAPYVVGVVLDSKSHDIQLAWNLVFFTSAAICGVSGAAFAIFGSAERQSWDIVKAT